MTDGFTEEQLVEKLRTFMKSTPGAQQRFCDETGVSKQYLSDVLSGRASPGPKILKAMGMARRVVYVPIESEAK